MRRTFRLDQLLNFKMLKVPLTLLSAGRVALLGVPHQDIVDNLRVQLRLLGELRIHVLHVLLVARCVVPHGLFELLNLNALASFTCSLRPPLVVVHLEDQWSTQVAQSPRSNWKMLQRST